MHEPRSARRVVTEIAARSGSNVEPRIREARSDDGCDVGPHGHVSVDVDPEVADRRNWLHVSGTNADRTRRDLMLSTRRCFEMPSTLLKKRVEKFQKQYQNHQNTMCQIVNNFKLS